MPGHAAATAATEGTIQVPQITRGRALMRAIAAPDFAYVPAVGSGDVEIIMSTSQYQGDFDYGGIYAVGDKIMFFAENNFDNWGAGTPVHRYGDAFTVALDQDAVTRRNGSLLNTRDGNYEFANTNKVGQNVNYLVLSDSLVIAHRTNLRTVSYSEGEGRDEFMALTLNPDTLTGEWSPVYQPLHDNGAFRTLHHDGYSGNDSYYKMCRLDDTHLAIIGRLPRASGRPPIMFILEWTGDGFDTYGPWEFGAKSDEGGHDHTGAAFLFPCSNNRVLAVWSDASISDFTNTWYAHSNMMLCAQVLSYDLTGHTATAGDLFRCESGVEPPGAYHGFFYPDGDVAVIANLNYMPVDQIGNQSVNYVGGDEHLAARTLIVDGTSVRSGAVARIQDAAYSKTEYGDYWYDMQVIPCGDRLVFLGTDAGTGEVGNIVYTKVRVGLSGAERGAIGAYETGNLYNGNVNDYEFFRYWQGITLSTGEGLGLIEHYINDYLVREPS
jgi:hypothetical protein